jgi:pimeloyl-ACP methyl ester carboxylesterase
MNTTTQNFRGVEELVPRHWTEGTTSRGIHYYRTGGPKPALLLLHGFMMSGLSWLRLAKVLEQNYELVMPDLRAHGRSVGVEQGYTIELQTEDMANLIRELGLDKPAVIGHSNGAMLATYLAAFHPHLLRLAASTAYWPMGSTTHEEDFVTWVEAQAQFNLGLFDLPGVYNLPPWRDQVSRITCSILLIVANQMRGPGSNSGLAESVVDSAKPGQVQLERFDTGHFIHTDQPDRFVEVVNKFLRAR